VTKIYVVEDQKQEKRKAIVRFFLDSFKLPNVTTGREMRFSRKKRKLCWVAKEEEYRLRIKNDDVTAKE
jgi:hypothetical protein